MALSSEFVALVQQEIPEGRQSLTDSHANLDKVAAYCIDNFAKSDNKHAALEETKNYTTQSLASVAYQINTLAYNFLQMMDQQANQLAEMESQVNYIAEMVMIHKEKVARREIGVLTTSKSIARQFKILAPSNTEKPVKYVRRPIDFNLLDEVGHGIRSASSNTPRSSRRSTTTSSSSIPASSTPVAQPPVNPQPQAAGGGIYAPSAGPPPTTKPPTPPQSNRSVTSLARGSREYRTPPAVAPPTVPMNYAPNYPIGHPRRNESAQMPPPNQQQRGYNTLPHPHNNQPPPPPSQPPAPQVGMVQPMQQQQHNAGGYGMGMQQHLQHHPDQQLSHYGVNTSVNSMPRYPTVIRPAMTLPKNMGASSIVSHAANADVKSPTASKPENGNTTSLPPPPTSPPPPPTSSVTSPTPNSGVSSVPSSSVITHAASNASKSLPPQQQYAHHTSTLGRGVKNLSMTSTPTSNYGTVARSKSQSGGTTTTPSGLGNVASQQLQQKLQMRQQQIEEHEKEQQRLMQQKQREEHQQQMMQQDQQQKMQQHLQYQQQMHQQQQMQYQRQYQPQQAANPFMVNYRGVQSSNPFLNPELQPIRQPISTSNTMHGLTNNPMSTVPAPAGMVEVTLAAPPSPATTSMMGDMDYSRQSSGGTSSPPLPPPPPQDGDSMVGAVPPVYLEKVIAVYDYTADKEDELSFSENAVVYVLKKNDDGWWEGILDGVTGLFPGNYVEPLM